MKCPTSLTFSDSQVRQGKVIGFKSPDHSTRWLQITTQPMVMPGEREVGAVVSTFTDVTERRREEEARQVFTQRLIETQRLESLGLLAGRIAADFGDLLTGVGGYIELAQNRGERDPELCNLLKQARSGVQRVSQLTEQLQAYAGKPLFVLKNLRIAEIVDEVIRLLRSTLSKRCVIEVEAAPNLPPLSGDAVQIRQLMLNLLLNAVEALAGREGRITARARAEECGREAFEHCVAGSTAVPGPYIVLEVADNGPGMDSLLQAQIFEPYFTTKEPGRGLGLAAALGIVRGHRGAISVSSVPGSGSLFRVYLPVQAAPEASMPAAPAAAIRRILIVDDNATLRTVVSQMVRNLGYEVESAGTRQEAVRLLESPDRHVDLTLLDVVMPGGSLEESLRAIAQAHPRAKVLLMSGYHDQPLTVQTDGLCMAGFLRKPFDICQLAEAVHLAMNKAEAEPR
ncbi:MAG: response regulator [Planctomycetes bacterium]|nr:response regulator [Planctomycetota bacterium]